MRLLTLALLLLLVLPAATNHPTTGAPSTTEARPLRMLVLFWNERCSEYRALFWLWWKPWVELFNLSALDLTREKLFAPDGSLRYSCIVVAGSYEGPRISNAEAAIIADFVFSGGGYLGLDYSMLLLPAIRSMCDVEVYPTYVDCVNTTIEVTQRTPFIIDKWEANHPIQKRSGPRALINVTQVGPRCSIAMRFNASVTDDPYPEPALLYGTYGEGRFIQFCGSRDWLPAKPASFSPQLAMAFWCSQRGIALAPLRSSPILLFTDLGNPTAPAPEYNESLDYVAAAYGGYPVLLCTSLHPNSTTIPSFVSLLRRLYRRSASASIQYYGPKPWSLTNETELVTCAQTLFSFYEALGLGHSHVIYPLRFNVSCVLVERAWWRISLYATWGPTVAYDDPAVAVEHPFGIILSDGYWNSSLHSRRLWAWVSGHITGWNPSMISSLVLPPLRQLSSPLVYVTSGEQGSYHYVNSNPDILKTLETLDEICTNHTGVLKGLSPDFIAIHAWERWYTGIESATWFLNNHTLHLRLNATLRNPLLIWVWTDGRCISNVNGFLPAWVRVTDHLYYVVAPPGFQEGWIQLGDSEPPHLTWVGDLNVTDAYWDPQKNQFIIVANPLGRHVFKLYQLRAELPQPRYVLHAAFRIDNTHVEMNTTDIRESTCIQIVCGPELPRFQMCTALLQRVEQDTNCLSIDVEPLLGPVRILLRSREPTAVFVDGQPLPRSYNGTGWWYAGGLLDIRASEATHHLEVFFAQGPEVTVTAIDLDRKPAPDVLLELVDTNHTVVAKGEGVLHTTVPAGNYTVIATRFGWEVGRITLSVGRGRCIALIECSVRSLTVSVVDRYGREAPNAVVELWINDTLCLQTVASSDGTAQISSVPTQVPIYLRVRFRSVTATLRTIVGAQSFLTITVPYPPRLLMRIVDAEGQLATTPLTVQLLYANGSSFLSTSNGEASTYVTSGDVRVTIWCGGRVVASDIIQVYNDTVATVQTVLTTLYVHVLSAAGTPVADAVVTLPEYGLQRKTGVNGTVAFRNLPPGPTQVVVELADLRASAEVIVSPPATYLSIALESRAGISAPPPPMLFLLVFLVLALLVVVVNELRR